MSKKSFKFDTKMLLGIGALGLTFLAGKLTEKQEDLEREEFKEEIKKEIFDELNNDQSDGE